MTGPLEPADELAVRNVVARLAHLADAGDVDAYVSLFAADGVWEMPPSPHVGLDGSRRVGRDDIAAGARDRIAAGLQGAGSGTMHVVSTTAVDADGAGGASATSYFTFCSARSTPPSVLSMGRYDDELVRTPGGWKLARRVVQFP